MKHNVCWSCFTNAERHDGNFVLDLFIEVLQNVAENGLEALEEDVCVCVCVVFVEVVGFVADYPTSSADIDVSMHVAH